MSTLRHQIGQLFLIGLSGPSLTPVERAILRLLRPGGVILFRRNIEAAAQTTALLREAAEAAGGDGERIPFLRALDLEGGLVDRLRDLLGPTPSPAAVAVHGSAALARRHGELIGRACRLLGFHTPLAPVLDLHCPVLRTRSAGPTPSEVLAYAGAFIEGLHAERVLACGKHFPGLGGSALDSHHATPSIPHTFERLWAEDLRPYRELASKLPIVMAAHAMYPAADDRLASTSRYWLTEVLRRKLDYEGLILSDDMEMGGLLSQTGIEEASVEALLAGTDLLEVCRDPALILRAYEAVLGEAERSAAFRDRVRRTAARVQAHKHRLLSPLLPRDATEAPGRGGGAYLRVLRAELDAVAGWGGLGVEVPVASRQTGGFENAL